MSLGSGVIPAWLLGPNRDIDDKIDSLLAKTRGNYKEKTMFDNHDFMQKEMELLGSDQDAPGEFIQLDDDVENEVDVDEY